MKEGNVIISANSEITYHYYFERDPESEIFGSGFNPDYPTRSLHKSTITLDASEMNSEELVATLSCVFNESFISNLKELDQILYQNAEREFQDFVHFNMIDPRNT